MANDYVKIDQAEMSLMEQDIQKACEALDNAEEIWGQKFADLYADFFEPEGSSFVDMLYKDAESNYQTLAAAASGIALAGGAAAKVITAIIASASIPVVGWIIAIVSFLFGIHQLYKATKTPEWVTVSREAFKALLLSCKNCADDNYIRLSNLRTRFFNMQVNIQKIYSKLDEFNETYGDMREAAGDLKLSTGGEDGRTIKGVVVEIDTNGDGTNETMFASEAMSALYTYATTVTSAAIQADYLFETHGIDVDFMSLVVNANSFMADTIKSGLYSHEVLSAMFPESYGLNGTNTEQYDEETMRTRAMEQSGLTAEQLEEALGLVAGATGLGLATGLLAHEHSKYSPPVNNPGDTTNGDGDGDKDSSGDNTGYDDGGYNSGGYNDNTGGDTTTETPTETPTNTVEISPVTDIKLPEGDEPIKVELAHMDAETGEIDYDALARESVEFEMGSDAIEQHRLELMTQVEEQYSSGNFAAITTALATYGYTQAEISTIITSKSMTVKAMLDGDARATYAARAEEMAKEAGVKDYKSKYKTKKPTLEQLQDDGAQLDTLTISSSSEELVEMREDLADIQAAYESSVETANKDLDAARAQKEALDKLKAEYTEKFKSDDPSKWDEASAKTYDDAVDKYNEYAAKAEESIATADKNKELYQTSRKEFEEARDKYLASLEDPSNGGNVNQGDFNMGNVSGGNTGGNTGTTGNITIPELVIKDGVASIVMPENNTGNTGTTSATGTNAFTDDYFLNMIGFGNAANEDTKKES